MPHQCRKQGYNPCPGPSGHTIAGTCQHATGLLGQLGSLGKTPRENILSGFQRVNGIWFATNSCVSVEHFPEECTPEISPQSLINPSCCGSQAGSLLAICRQPRPCLHSFVCPYIHCRALCCSEETFSFLFRKPSCANEVVFSRGQVPSHNLYWGCRFAGHMTSMCIGRHKLWRKISSTNITHPP